jgi:hypothetical protein
MGQADFLRVGDYNAICDVCGRKFKFSRLRQKWDNTWACEQDWEPRQPQDYLKGIKDNMSVPLSRPDPPNLFIQDEIVTESPVITLSFIKALLKSLAVSVSSLVTILKNVYPFTPASKVVDGAALNTTTLG